MCEEQEINPSLEKIRSQIQPAGIDGFDEFYLFPSGSGLYLLFSSNRSIYVIRHFKINQLFDFVLRGEFSTRPYFMRMDSSNEIVRHSRVKDCVLKIGHDIDEIFMLFHHIQKIPET